MIDAKALVERTDIVAVVSAYTKLKKLGAEYAGPCPLHGGTHDNFYVNPQKRIWSCFSRGCHEGDEGNDVIGFLRKAENLTFKDACAKLGATDNWKPTERIPQKAEARPDRVTSKPPAGAGRPAMKIAKLGEPMRTWDYLDADGALLGCVARYETPEGKQIRCWTWGAKGDEAPGWGCGHWTKPRPLYGLDRLAARPEARVAIVEGEKAADAAQRLLPQMVVVTWPGGANAWKHCDLEPLRGRNVLLWPDNDAPGAECMERLAALLADPAGLGCTLRVLDPAGMAEGFDAADWPDSPADLITWATPRIKAYQPNPAPQGGGGSNPPPPPDPSPPAEAGPLQDVSEPPPAEFPPEATLTVKPARPTRQRPRLAAVDGNTALATDADAEALPASMSEDAIADAFAAEIERDWRYVHAWGEWLQWDGDGWRRDKKELIDRLAVEMCRRACLWDDARSLTPDGRRKLGQRRTAGAVRDMARNDRRIAASPDGWDADPLLVGIPGGVFDVRAGKVIMGEREQYITLRTAVAPEPGEPRRWLEHMRRMTDGDQDMIDFLHLYAGYAATGDVREQCFVFLYGMGQTGKGTFLLTLAELLGDYAAQAAASTFMSANQEKHTSEIARLASKRLVVIDETDGTARWNEERIKRMTGGGRITAARKYHDETDIQVTWKLAFAGNHKPALRGVGKEMERRIRLVKCNASIPDETVDRNFRAAMIASEGPQILNWILQGAVRWLDSGLPLPEKISDATRDYLTSEDVIGDWIGECCEDSGEVERPVAYRNYAAWAERRGDRPWGNRAWWSAMEDRGFTSGKRVGLHYIKGLSLKAGAAPEPQGWAVD